MKKVIATITLAIYLVVSSGVVINFHFCMDELASVHLYESESGTCGKCGMVKKSTGCCRDEVTVIKITDDQQQTQLSNVYQAPLLIISANSEYFNEPVTVNDHRVDWQNHSPPLLSEQDTYLVNRVFRI